MNTHDLRYIHGSRVTQKGLELFDNGKLAHGDVILFPDLYRAIYKETDSRADFYVTLLNIESFTCAKDYSYSVDINPKTG